MAEPKVRFKQDGGSSYTPWDEHRIGEFLSESRIVGSKGDEAKKLTVKLWGKGVVEKNTAFDGSKATQYYKRSAGQFIYGKLDFLHGAFGIIPEDLDGYESTLDSPAFDMKNIIPKYFLEYVGREKFYLTADDTANGSRKAKRIHPDVFCNMIMHTPCLEEQQKIADFLSLIDDVFAASEEEIACLEKQKKAVMKKIFSQEVRFMRADGSDFPEWEEMTIGDLGEMHGGLSGKTKEDFGHGDSSFITYMNVYKNPFASPDLLEKVDVKPNEKQYAIHYGDVMFTQSSETVEEVGLSSVWMYHTEPYMNSFCMVLRPSDLTRLIPEFVGYLFRSDDVRKQIMLQGQGVTRVNLAPSRLVDVRFKYPLDVEEQRFIAGFLSNFDEAIAAAKKELELWKELKKGLLQQMFV